MAYAVTVASGDSIHKIQTRRGVKAHETTTWLAEVRAVNPHFSEHR